MRLDLTSLRNQLPDRQIHWFPSLDSTMTEASRLAGAGCPSGTVVVADEQRAGQGRYGRAWYSEKEAGLYVSVVLRLTLPADTLPVVTMAMALAAAEAIALTSELTPDLRWPNDVLLYCNDDPGLHVGRSPRTAPGPLTRPSPASGPGCGSGEPPRTQGKKCAGVLAQLSGGAIVAGLGINVNHAAFPEEIRHLATSLRMVSGRIESREQLLVNLLAAIDRFCTILVMSGKKAVLEAFSRSSSFLKGRRVTVDRGDSVLHGVTEGLDPSGFLILREDDGTRIIIVTGGVREEG
jgi:BirA family biotin operon repressor/biotin-[acetyl-CoA-carboxylase] ligase